MTSRLAPVDAAATPLTSRWLVRDEVRNPSGKDHAQYDMRSTTVFDHADTALHLSRNTKRAQILAQKRSQAVS